MNEWMNEWFKEAQFWLCHCQWFTCAGAHRAWRQARLPRRCTALRRRNMTCDERCPERTAWNGTTWSLCLNVIKNRSRWTEMTVTPTIRKQSLRHSRSEGSRSRSAKPKHWTVQVKWSGMLMRPVRHEAEAEAEAKEKFRGRGHNVRGRGRGRTR